MDPEKRKSKTSHLSATEIEGALNIDEETTPKSTHSSSARRKLVLPTKIIPVSHEASADLFEDSVSDICHG